MDSCEDTLAGGLPHSDIHGSNAARGSPWLFAACHVLHRLLVPRHPPNALLSFNFPNLTTDRDDRTNPVRYPPCTGTIHQVQTPKSSNHTAARNDNEAQFNPWRQNPMMYDCAGRSFIMLLNTRDSCDLWQQAHTHRPWSDNPITKTRTNSRTDHRGGQRSNRYAYPDAPKPIHPDKEQICSSTLKLGANIRPSIASDLFRNRRM